MQVRSLSTFFSDITYGTLRIDLARPACVYLAYSSEHTDGPQVQCPQRAIVQRTAVAILYQISRGACTHDSTFGELRISVCDGTLFSTELVTSPCVAACIKRRCKLIGNCLLQVESELQGGERASIPP